MPTTFASFGGETKSTPSSVASLPVKKSAFDSFGGEDVYTPPTLPPAETYGAWFPSKPTDTALTAGLKAVGNVPSSAFNFGKMVFDVVKSPVQSAKAVGEVIGEGIGTLGGLGYVKAKEVLGLAPKGTSENYDISTPKFDQITAFLKDRYGSVENLQRTATNDPVGIGADIVSLLQGGAGIIGKTAQLNKGLSTVAKTVTRPAELVGEGVGKTTRFGISQGTGLNPETVSSLVNEPATFSAKALQAASRDELGKFVKTEIDSRIRSLSDLGSGYDEIRKMTTPVIIDRKAIEEVLNSYGVKIENGKVKTTAESVPLSSADKTSLEDFYNTYGAADQLSPNAFMNTREALAQLAKYDASKTGNLNQISRDLRAKYNEIARPQIPGLEKLDSQYAPEVKQLKQIKKDYIGPTGGFKDGAINKIANLTGEGKQQVLGRLKQIVPDIEKRIQIVRVAEDIERASGIKVGTYARAGVGIAGITTGNIPAIVAAILASPEIATRLLRLYGLTKNQVGAVLRALYGVANDLAGFRLPVGVEPEKFLEQYFSLKFGTIEELRKRIELTPNKQGGFARIKITDAEYDRVSRALEKYDTTPATVGGAPAIENVDTEFRLEQLKTKQKRTALSNDEIAEARTLLEKVGAIEKTSSASSPRSSKEAEKGTQPSPNDTTVSKDVQADASAPFEGEYLYHGTSKTAFENIMKEGIKPQRRGVTSLSKSEDYSKNWAFPEATKTQGVMLRVKANAVKTTPSTSGVPSDTLNELLTKEIISPKDIEVFKDGKWQPLIESSPLLQEAKKYKTAEEFVKAQGTPVYHGTDVTGAGSISQEGFKLMESGNAESGISLSTNKNISSIFSGKDGKILDVVIAPDIKLMAGDEFDAILGKLVREKKMPYKTKQEQAIVDSLAAKEAKKLGYDGVDWRGQTEGIESLSDEIRIWNITKIKTRAQLLDIWKRANNK